MFWLEVKPDPAGWWTTMHNDTTCYYFVAPCEGRKFGCELIQC